VNRVVVVGSGHGGFAVASAVRERDPLVEVVLIGREAELPYQRPPLSKAFLAADEPNADELHFRPQNYYDEHRIGLWLNARVEKVEPHHGEVLLAGGKRVPYDSLVLATGARPRRLPCVPAGLGGVHELGTKADAVRLRSDLGEGRRVVIVGAGFIGLEVASAARAAGADVTVVEAAPRVMSRVVSPTTSEFFEKSHRSAAVNLITGVVVSEVLTSGDHVTGVLLSDGRSLPADVLIIGIGVQPRDELARAAGLRVEDGVVVDKHLSTSDPNIFAVGDCARFPMRSDLLVRLESVQNATDQARFVADRLAGSSEHYEQVPWFWSSQAGHKLQIAGLPTAPHDRTVQRGRLEDGRFSVFFFDGDLLVACESVNAPADHVVARRLIQSGTALDSERVSDTTAPVRALLN